LLQKEDTFINFITHPHNYSLSLVDLLLQIKILKN